MKIKIIFSGLALMSVFALAACAQPELPSDHYYRLQVVLPEKSKAKPVFKGTIEVERFLADGLTAGRPIVYSQAGSQHQLLEYHYHFWTEPPVVMLRDQLIDYLRAARVAGMVVSPEMRSRPDYRLTAKIKRLEKIVGPKPSVVVELQLGLQDEKSGAIRHLANYRVEVGAASPGVGDAVIAMNKALSKIYSQLVSNLRKL